MGSLHFVRLHRLFHSGDVLGYCIRQAGHRVVLILGMMTILWRTNKSKSEAWLSA